MSEHAWPTRVVLVALTIQLTYGCGSDAPPPAGPCGGIALVEPLSQALSPGPECKPTLGLCPHRGGDAIHNACADREAPNVGWPPAFGSPPGMEGQGCDVILGARNFDAMSWDSKQEHRILWEVKTADWSNANKYDDDLKKCVLDRAIETFITDCVQIMTCNKDCADPALKLYYALAIADAGLYHAIDDYFALPGNLNELKKRLPKGVVENPLDYCGVVNKQSCRR